MRPIKFRGKRIDNGEWVEGDLIHGQTGNLYILSSPGDWIHVRNDSVGQFTGLQDKNGVDIFEGDKWKLEENAGVIRFDKGSFMIDCFYSLREFAEHIEITGTIHDTPSEKGK